MPIIKSKSKKAFEHNLKAEESAGKPPKQALAIAFSIKKKAPKKYAKGGQIPPEVKKQESLPELKKEMDNIDMKKPKLEPQSGPKMAQSKLKIMNRNDADRIAAMKSEGATLNYPDMKKEMIEKNKPKFGNKMAEGGEVEESLEDNSPQHMEIILKEGKPEHNEDKQEMPEHYSSIAEAIMAKKKMAEGGQVDIEENNEEQPNSFYEQNEHEALDWDMDDGADIDQPMDSNLHGDDLNSDELDMISKLRSKMAVKRALK